MRPGTKWLSVFRQPIGKDLRWAANPDANTHVRQVHRVGTFKEMGAVLHKLIRRGTPADRIALVFYDGKELKLRHATGLPMKA